MKFLQKLKVDLLSHLRFYAIATVYGLFAALLIEKFHAARWLIYVAAASAIITHLILEHNRKNNKWAEEIPQPTKRDS